jgi:hypothetical protein
MAAAIDSPRRLSWRGDGVTLVGDGPGDPAAFLAARCAA